MLNPYVMLIDNHRNYVETNIAVPIHVKDILLGGFHDEAALGGIHKFFGHSKTDIGAGFHLGKNQDFVLFGNDINFGMTKTVITGENLIAFFFQKSCSFVFAQFTRVQMFCHSWLVEQGLPVPDNGRKLLQGYVYSFILLSYKPFGIAKVTYRSGF